MSLKFRSKKVKLSKTRRKTELLSKKWAKSSNVPRLISLCVTLVCSWFWRPSRCPNLLQVGFLERSACLLSNTSGISEFGFHLPLQNWVLPTLLPMCQKRGRKVIFWVFLTLLKPKTCQNFLAIGRHAYFSIKNPKILSLHQKESRGA